MGDTESERLDASWEAEYRAAYIAFAKSRGWTETRAQMMAHVRDFRSPGEMPVQTAQTDVLEAEFRDVLRGLDA